VNDSLTPSRSDDKGLDYSITENGIDEFTNK
jgi:hypothetical protein